MITKNELGRLWSEITHSPNAGRRADTDHPMNFFIGYDENLNMQLMLVTSSPTDPPESSKQIIVRMNKRNDDNFATCLSLADNALSEQYISVCWDIMDCTRSLHSERQGAQAAIKRFKMWQRLFAEPDRHQLSELKAKGLIGELSVLKEICVPKYGINASIEAWTGPLAEDRDFEFNDTWYESKYVSLSMDEVQLSSLDQLDTDKPGHLVLCRAEKTAVTVVGYITLNQLADDIISIIKDENTLTTFQNRLLMAGYDKESVLAKQPYMIHRLERYLVDSDSFPRLRRSRINSAITEGKYSLSIPAIREYIE